MITTLFSFFLHFRSDIQRSSPSARPTSWTTAIPESAASLIWMWSAACDRWSLNWNDNGGALWLSAIWPCSGNVLLCFLITIINSWKFERAHQVGFFSGFVRNSSILLAYFPHCLCFTYCRCIYAYFMGVPIAELPFKDLHTHRIYELTPGRHYSVFAV